MARVPNLDIPDAFNGSLAELLDALLHSCLRSLQDLPHCPLRALKPPQSPLMSLRYLACTQSYGNVQKMCMRGRKTPQCG